MNLQSLHEWIAYLGPELKLPILLTSEYFIISLLDIISAILLIFTEH